MAKTFTLTFAGDTSLGDWYLRKTGKEHLVERLEKEPLSYFAGIKPLIEKSDHFILNLETVLEESPKPILEGKQYPNYDNPDRTLQVLKDLGVTAVGLANNHTMDFGSEVLLRTLNRLEEANIKTLGAGKDRKDASKPLKITLDGKKSVKNVYIFTGMRAGKRYREYGFFAENEKPGVSPLPQKGLSRKISNLRQEDPESIIIVCPHWQGEDYKWASDHGRIQERSRAFIDAGANYIFGHGPHMLNDIENYNGGTIAYSIGNFVFNSPGRYEKLDAPPYSVVVNMEIQEEGGGTWIVKNKFYPIVTDNKKTNYSVRKINEKETEDIVYKFDEDELGLYIENTKHDDKCASKSEVNEIIAMITGEKKINQDKFKGIDSVEKQILALKEAQDRIDKNLKNYYSKLIRSKSMKRVEDENYHLYQMLADTIKKDYITHGMYLKFGKRKLNIHDAISFQNFIIQNAESKRLGNPYYAQMLDKKLPAYEFADKIGLRRPYTDPNVYKFSELKPQTGPVVVKPTSATGAMGVYLIYNENKILSVRDGKYLNSWDELVNDVQMEIERDKARVRKYFKKDAWMIEELIIDPEKPDSLTDLKFHVFYGENVLVQEVIREDGGNKYQFWDANNKKVFTGKLDGEDQIYKEAKGFNNEDLDAIIQASLEIPAPFMRIDMLKGNNELVFGEATYYPGGFHNFNAEWDRRLGEAYVNAEARLKRDLLEGKEFKAFNETFFRSPSLTL
ncbi:CapA family protein [Salicibibacter cibi]|uniref:CapA family protein n=1 Tax=Salicibibacter cibi TaxID=2743001 RepID=A0A7T6Z7P1_9BACI|nr:CapA family protein [Salicibibacter cibi]QQK78495.1 CapA family protein [Salicibibacter cibi]